MNIILKLKGKKTIFYSTHILDDVERVCDRIGLLDKGKLVLEDTVGNIITAFMSNEVYIETKEEPKEVVKFLLSKNINNKLMQSDKAIKCQLESETTAQDILKLLVDNNFHIIEFRQLRASLEDVFIKVTNEKST
jgi:ABC-2 type transport system ATP-binding protein